MVAMERYLGLPTSFYWLDSGEVNASFHDEWRDYCVGRRDARSRCAELRHKWHTRIFHFRNRLQTSHDRQVLRLKINAPFRKRTQAAHFSRTLCHILRLSRRLNLGGFRVPSSTPPALLPSLPPSSWVNISEVQDCASLRLVLDYAGRCGLSPANQAFTVRERRQLSFIRQPLQQLQLLTSPAWSLLPASPLLQPPPLSQSPPMSNCAFVSGEIAPLLPSPNASYNLLILSDDDLRCALCLRASGVDLKRIVALIEAEYPGFALSCKVVCEALQNADSCYLASMEAADLGCLVHCPGCEAQIPRSALQCQRCQYFVQQIGGGGDGSGPPSSLIDDAFKEIGMRPNGKYLEYQHREHAELRVPIALATAMNANSRRKQLSRCLKKFNGEPKEQRSKRPAASNQPAKEKAQRLEPVFRQRCWSRPNETESERRTRVRTAAGTRTERLQADRAHDLQVSSALQDQCAARGISRQQIWPPQAARDAPPISHLNGYYDELLNMASGQSIFSPHTCSNCNERGTDHAPGASSLCWFCRDPKRAPVLHNNNIDLNLDPHAPGIDAPTREARQAWADLREEFGELRCGRASQQPAPRARTLLRVQCCHSVMEEALVSRVSSFTSVLALPNGGQLGYRGSVINFVNDLGTVAAQLPRAPKDTGIILYIARGTRKDGGAYHQLVRVRRAAVEKHLRFFARYHKLYIEGVGNPYATSAADQWLVPPFTESMIDWAALKSLPVDGVPTGILERVSCLGSNHRLLLDHLELLPSSELSPCPCRNWKSMKGAVQMSFSRHASKTARKTRRMMMRTATTGRSIHDSDAL